jgi:hypothetical protein
VEPGEHLKAVESEIHFPPGETRRTARFPLPENTGWLASIANPEFAPNTR